MLWLRTRSTEKFATVPNATLASPETWTCCASAVAAAASAQDASTRAIDRERDVLFRMVNMSHRTWLTLTRRENRVIPLAGASKRGGWRNHPVVGVGSYCGVTTSVRTPLYAVAACIVARSDVAMLTIRLAEVLAPVAQA